jgi:hypothetical protein
VHIVKGELHPGDFVFPLFLFCSGASLWLYLCKLKPRGGGLAQAERKYLWLLLAALAISGMRLFVAVPDEVITIAVCGLVSLNIFWHFGLRGIAIAALALFASFALLAAIFPAFLAQASNDYIGGWAGALYFLVMYLAGFVVSQAAFPNGRFFGQKTYRTLSLWLLAFSALALACSFAWDFDRAALSPAFVPLSLSISTLMLLFFTWLCDSVGLRSRFLTTLGQNSLWGWALLCVLTTAFWLMGKKGAYLPGIYLPFCALLPLALYFVLLALGKGKK